MKGDLCLPSKAQIAHEILAYLAEHPDSQDTFDGIVQWWLLERKIKYQKTLVSEALAELIFDGYIVEHGYPGSHQLFGINEDMSSKIREIVLGRSSNEEGSSRTR